MEDVPEYQEFWILVCSFFGLCCWIGFNYPSFFYYSSWFRHPSQPLQTVSVAEPAFPPSPHRPHRPTPKYIALADLAKKVDKTWLGHYPPGDGMPAQTYPTRNPYAPPQRGRWVELSAAAGPAPPPVHNPEQHAASLAKFSAFMRASARASLRRSSSRGQRVLLRVGRARRRTPTTRRCRVLPLCTLRHSLALLIAGRRYCRGRGSELTLHGSLRRR